MHLPRLPLLMMFAALPLAAGEEGSIGLVAGWNGPTGEFKNDVQWGTHKSSGIHGGIQFRGSLNDWNDLRAQVVWLHFGGAGQGGLGQINRYEVRQVAVDWTHSFSAEEQRFYLVAGGSVNTLHARYEGPFSPSPTRFQHGVLGLRLGGGWAFSQHVQLEGSYNQVLNGRYGPDGFGIRPLSWAQASLIYQF